MKIGETRQPIDFLQIFFWENFPVSSDLSEMTDSARLLIQRYQAYLANNDLTLEKQFVFDEYHRNRSIRTKGHIITGALRSNLFGTLTLLADFLKVSKSRLSKERSAFGIPASVWKMYDIEERVSTAHTQKLIALKKEFGWPLIEQCALSLNGLVKSPRAQARFDALASKVRSLAAEKMGRIDATLDVSIYTYARIQEVNRTNRLLTFRFDDIASLDRYLAGCGSLQQQNDRPIPSNTMRQVADFREIRSSRSMYPRDAPARRAQTNLDPSGRTCPLPSVDFGAWRRRRTSGSPPR